MTRLPHAARRSFPFILFSIAASLVLFLAFEGTASVLYAVHGAFANQTLAERLHTEYDRDLGWVNLPNVNLANMYGKGIYLRTNGQRFRNDADFSTRVPAGKTRIVCSGDSFTLGYGVDNDHTWPQLLASRAEGIETVNMGQGGYGADQAYLWHKRDGVKLDHDIHVFAFIANDFKRMQNRAFDGYGKPILAVENDRLVTRNIPVPSQAWAPVLARTQAAISSMSTTRLLRRILRLDNPDAVAQAQNEGNQETLRILPLMFADLVETNRAKNSVLVLAYLPRSDEYGGDLQEPWRAFLAEYARQHGLLYLDFVDDLRRLAPTEIDRLFIAKGAIDFPGAAGHYTEEGNRFIADLMYRRLIAIPDTGAKLHRPS